MPIGTYLNAIEKIKETTYVLYFTLCGIRFFPEIGVDQMIF